LHKSCVSSKRLTTEGFGSAHHRVRGRGVGEKIQIFLVLREECLKKPFAVAFVYLSYTAAFLRCKRDPRTMLRCFSQRRSSHGLLRRPALSASQHQDPGDNREQGQQGSPKVRPGFEFEHEPGTSSFVLLPRHGPQAEEGSAAILAVLCRVPVQERGCWGLVRRRQQPPVSRRPGTRTTPRTGSLRAALVEPVFVDSLATVGVPFRVLLIPPSQPPIAQDQVDQPVVMSRAGVGTERKRQDQRHPWVGGVSLQCVALNGSISVDGAVFVSERRYVLSQSTESEMALSATYGGPWLHQRHLAECVCDIRTLRSPITTGSLLSGDRWLDAEWNATCAIGARYNHQPVHTVPPVLMDALSGLLEQSGVNDSLAESVESCAEHVRRVERVAWERAMKESWLGRRSSGVGYPY